jgi:hypothetical protein
MKKKQVKWHGLVTDINDSYFTAKLVEITKTSKDIGTYEIGEIDLCDISEKDLEFVELGALFIYTIDETGVTIEFLPPTQLTQEEIEEAYQRAEKLARSINWI